MKILQHVMPTPGLVRVNMVVMVHIVSRKLVVASRVAVSYTLCKLGGIIKNRCSYSRYHTAVVSQRVAKVGSEPLWTLLLRV